MLTCVCVHCVPATRVLAAFHLIDSMGTLKETQEAISLELRCVL